MTENRTNEQSSDDLTASNDQGVMTESEQVHGTGGQTANVAGGVGRTGALESQSDEQDVEDRGSVPPA